MKLRPPTLLFSGLAVVTTLFGCQNDEPATERAETGGATLTGQGGSTQTGQGGSTQTGQGGSTQTGQGGSTLTGQGGSTLTGQGGATLTGQGGATLTGQGGSTLTGQGGSTQTGQGGSTQTGQGGSTLTGQGGSTLTGQGGATGTCTVGPALSGGIEYCQNGLGPLGNGYAYEVWMDSGNNCATMYGEGAAFRATWDLGERGDFLGRAGLSFGATEPHDRIGRLSADYAFRRPDDNGFSWVAIYGWTFDELAEYYIVEDFSVYRPGTTYEHRGTLESDGGIYDIYYNRREGATSPQGPNTDFDQFWSVRREPRQCGHVSISAHFSAWQNLGMDMSGRLREAMIVVEALNGTGTVDFASATVTVD